MAKGSVDSKAADIENMKQVVKSKHLQKSIWYWIPMHRDGQRIKGGVISFMQIRIVQGYRTNLTQICKAGEDCVVSSNDTWLEDNLIDATRGVDG